MIKKTIIHITTSIICSSTLVVVLFLTSFDFSDQHNDFLRQYLPHVIFNRDTINLKYNSYYIAGVSRNHLYIGSSTAPTHVIDFNLSSKDTTHIKISISNADSILFKSVRLKVDSPYFALGDGTVPEIFIGKIDTWKAHRITSDNDFFVEFMPIEKESFILRSMSAQNKEYELGKQNSQRFELKPELLQKQVDGMFCLDGLISYDKTRGRVIYTYFYRNQFIVTDTSLNLIFRGKTIDTISHTKITVDTIKSTGVIKLNGNYLMVNKSSATDAGYLYINSALRAKNEDDESFDNGSVIDAYNTLNGKYVLSFYINNFNNAAVRDLKVFDNKLFALFENNILIYDLRQEYFPNQKAENLLTRN